MSERLFRFIVGPVVPLDKRKEQGVPAQFRRTAPQPSANMNGSESSEPRGDSDPTTENPAQP